MAANQMPMMSGYVDPHTFGLGGGFWDDLTFGAGAAYCGVRLDTDGRIRVVRTSGTSVDSFWITPQTNMSDYEVMFDNQTGVISAAPDSFGVWLPLTSNRGVYSSIAAYGNVNGTCRTRIRHAVTQVVLATLVWDLSANAEF